MAHTAGTFSTDKPALKDILREIEAGEVQLPDFQRGWVWDDSHIRSLIASVSLSYPVGAVMLLEVGGDGVRFKPRPVEGAAVGDVRPDRLILDGQQRLTSLFLALKSREPVPTRTEKGQEIKRHYYLDINACTRTDVDREDAVISVPENRIVRSDFGRKVDLDLSSPEREIDTAHFPLDLVFDTEASNAWRRAYQRQYRNDEARLDLWDRFESEVISRFQGYLLPVIELKKETPKEAVCLVFEKVNTGGVSLTVFELVTATFAADDFSLREDWEARKARLHKHPVLHRFDASAFLTAVTLFTSYRAHAQDGELAVSCKRRDVLRLTLSEYTAAADEIEAGAIRAARFLHRQHVFDSKSLPYTTQIIPLSAVCAELAERFENEAVRKKLAQWFWAGVFGELYGAANETRFALDAVDLLAWTGGGERLPRTVQDASFAPTRLLTLTTRNSAAYKGLFALLMDEGSNDFLSGDPIKDTLYFDGNVDIHHLFPAAYCEREQIPKDHWNSAVNKSPLTARTNRMIGGDAPSVYLRRLESVEGVPAADLDASLQSHALDPAAMRNDDFQGFLRDRAARLLDLIEGAMGKRVQGRESEETVDAFGGDLLTRTGSAASSS